jgi:hypothetical protein
MSRLHRLCAHYTLLIIQSLKQTTTCSLHIVICVNHDASSWQLHATCELWHSRVRKLRSRLHWPNSNTHKIFLSALHYTISGIFFGFSIHCVFLLWLCTFRIFIFFIFLSWMVICFQVASGLTANHGYSSRWIVFCLWLQVVGVVAIVACSSVVLLKHVHLLQCVQPWCYYMLVVFLKCAHQCYCYNVFINGAIVACLSMVLLECAQ